MSYYLLDFEKEVDFNKIIIGNEIIMENQTSRYYIYYLDEQPKEIFIKMPLIRLIYSYQNTKFNQIKLPIYPSWDKTNKFVAFIKKFERHIKKNIKTDSCFSSCFDEYNNLKSLKINLNNNIKIKSNLPNATIQDLRCGGEAEFIIKLSHIFDTNGNFGLKMNGYQLKYFPSVEQLCIDFWDDEPDKPKMDIILRSRQMMINYDDDTIQQKLPQQLTKVSNIIPLQINMAELLKMKNKLKKIC
jgi:hypothetical protein